MELNKRQRIGFLVVMLSTLIVICPLRASADSETALMTRVNSVLRQDDRLNGAYCYVTAPGVVVLHGTVFDRADRDLAETKAGSVRGVTQVVNGLLTKTGDWREEQARINDTLALNGFDDLTVRVIGSQAYLSGQVTGQSERSRALRVIASVSNLQVVNFSRVVPGSVF